MFKTDSERSLLYRIANALGAGPGVAGTAGAASVVGSAKIRSSARSDVPS